jgi:hypothetical protein
MMIKPEYSTDSGLHDTLVCSHIHDEYQDETLQCALDLIES